MLVARIRPLHAPHDSMWAMSNMAALMTAAMVLIELASMRHMYHNRRRTTAIVLGAAIVLIPSWIFIHDRPQLQSDNSFGQ